MSRLTVLDEISHYGQEIADPDRKATASMWRRKRCVETTPVATVATEKAPRCVALSTTG